MAFWTEWLPSGLTKDNGTSNPYDWRIWVPRALRENSQQDSMTKKEVSPKGSGETVFISYAREDFDKAKRLYDDLRRVNLNPWLDKESLRGG